MSSGHFSRPTASPLASVAELPSAASLRRAYNDVPHSVSQKDVSSGFCANLVRAFLPDGFIKFRIDEMSDSKSAIQLALCLLGIYGLVFSPASATTLEPFKLGYSITLGGFKIGNGILQLKRRDKTHYVYERSIRANALARLFVSDVITERSEWQLVNGHPQGIRFDSQEIDGNQVESETIEFDWTERKARISTGDGSGQLSISPEVLDKLTMEIRMMMDVRAKAQDYVYSVVHKGRVKTRRFISEAKETIETPAGAFKTLKFRLMRDDTTKRSTIFWLAKELQYLPVRIEHHEQSDGYVVAFELEHIYTPPPGI